MDDFRKQHLVEFVDWAARNVTGDEKGQAQIFLDRLFQAFGQRGCLDVGGQPEFRIRKSAQDGGGTAFADYVWKPLVLIEMKARGQDLSRHYRQAFDYWTRLAPGRPQYVVLCNFDEFWVYDFDSAQMDTPLDKVALSELPERYGPLAFLFPTREKPLFGNNHEEVTRQAADLLAVCFNKLVTRKVDRDLAQRFILQMLVALFAEDIGLLPKYLVARLIAEYREPSDSFDLLGGLFTQMNSPKRVTGGRFKDVDYFNGGIFSAPACIELYPDEVMQLSKAAESNWSKVRPEIFGTLFEHSLEKEERHAFGAHFTSPLDIMKIVGPTIVEPWRDRIENASRKKELGDLLERMRTFTVLDPACGSGNFLYIAYRELKRLEARIWERLAEKTGQNEHQRALGFVTGRQFYGIDMNPFAVELAKVSMMIARKLAIEELHVTEAALPLDNLDANFIIGDALLGGLGANDGALPTIQPWPPADVIIGNPPFLGAKRFKPERGADYVNTLRKAYPLVPGMADYCVYWFRRAQDHLPPCTPEDPFAGRAGLVGTQNIRNNQSRVGGLDYIAANGTIVEAVDNQPWSGEANVHVSIANWVKTKAPELLPKTRKLWSKVEPPAGTKKIRKPGTGPASKIFELSFRDCAFINSALSDGVDVSEKRVLECNKIPKRCFQGKIPGYEGFLLDSEQVTKLGGPSEVIVPYLTGRELLDDFHIDRWAIDFDRRSMPSAARFVKAFDHLRDHVLPAVRKAYELNNGAASDMTRARMEHLERWWQFWNRRDELSMVLNGSHRYIACSRVTRRPVMVFLSARICPSDLIQVFGFDDDYSFGVLQSAIHFVWFRTSSRLKVETDLRYSVRSIFETFPWPQHPSRAQVRAVADSSRELRRIRERLMGPGQGLRWLYRQLELPGRHPLKIAHADLDDSVRQVYGFAKDDILLQLLELNQSVFRTEQEGGLVTKPGIPCDYTTPQDLITKDCLEP